jgi:glycogen debranching enzyme
MAEYTRTTARMFHGVRLDNCHSTPIHVAQYYLDIARSIQPNLFVIAELFTNSVSIDNMFASELGITSLIREAMNAWNANELGRLVHRFGGEPVGSFYQATHIPLVESTAHAVLYDVTHDNPCLIKMHSVYDPLATASLVLMAGCSTGSTRGFDELVPHSINVVTEQRLYAAWKSSTTEAITKEKSSALAIDLDDGIMRGKLLMNKLHYEMGSKRFNQLYVDQFDSDTTVITRHNPQTHESIVLVARTAFYTPSNHTNNNLHRPLILPSRIESVLFEASIEKKSDELNAGDQEEFQMNEKYINGLSNYKCRVAENIAPETSHFIGRIDYDGSTSHVHFKSFPPGTVLAFRVVLNESTASVLPHIRQSIGELMNSCVIGSTRKSYEIEAILNSLTFDELNVILFRCSSEEVDEQIDSDVYDVPKYGRLIYCGLQGFMNVLEKERLSNNLGHPLYENLRQGDWMMQYISERLIKHYNLAKKYRATLYSLAVWLRKLFDSLSKLPRYLIPAYFDLIVSGLYSKCLERCWSLMDSKANSKLAKFEIVNGSSFVRMLALGSVSLCGYLRSSKLPESGDPLEADLPMLSMSAGLPHFSSTYMRNWGRDTFISLRGLLLLTSRFEDARRLILAYSACLRHGLVPNLLGEGKLARYNCRDAVWWWLQSVKDYAELAPDGMDILNSLVYRLYPTDEADYPASQNQLHDNRQKLADLVQEALTVHVRGLKFRERNAGKSIDEHMTSEGFNNQIGVDLKTGFVFGGNSYNCGTWMDKLGSSHKAGNYGMPATPRDGSAVELVGLCRSVLEWLIKANEQGKYSHDGVELADGVTKFTWVEWAKRIDASFEKHFWINESSTESPHINKKNIYKDTLGSSVPWADYQLRPNFLIALALAPQMICKENALKALEQCRLHLMNEPNSVGIKTLDSSDYNYCGTYDNSNDGYDRRVAHGFNYHNGPEWLA